MLGLMLLRLVLVGLRRLVLLPHAGAYEGRCCLWPLLPMLLLLKFLWLRLVLLVLLHCVLRLLLSLR